MNKIKKEWFIYIPEEGDWQIDYDGEKEEEARKVYLKRSNRERLPTKSRIWSR